MEWSKRKFKINGKAKRICEMSEAEATVCKRHFHDLANAAELADKAGEQTLWTGFEMECEDRLKELDQ